MEKIEIEIDSELRERLDSLSDTERDRLIKQAVNGLFSPSVKRDEREMCRNCAYNDISQGYNVCLVHSHEIMDVTSTCSQCLTHKEKEAIQREFDFAKDKLEREQAQYKHESEQISRQILIPNNKWESCKSCRYYNKLDVSCLIQISINLGIPIKLYNDGLPINARFYKCDKYEEIDYSNSHVLDLDNTRITVSYLYQALIEHNILSKPDKVSIIKIDNNLKQKLITSNVLEPVGLKFRKVVVDTLSGLGDEAKIDYYSYETIRRGIEEG